MRATNILLAAGLVVFAIFFFDRFSLQSDRVDISGPVTLGAFQFLGAAACLYLISRGNRINASLLDLLGCAATIFVAGMGFAGASITLFAVYLFFRFGHDSKVKAAGMVAMAVAVQAVWAPLIFSKLSFLFLQIDAGVVGFLISLAVPGASWDGTVVFTPSGHNVEITSACASFHNLSLASLCWVTLTMLHRPYWVQRDLYNGLAVVLIQFVLNIWRLIFVCLSLPMYEFWHDGIGRHIFSAVATASAIIFVQVSLGATSGAGKELRS
jgi:exosortase/archaeosortase family protein